VERLIAEMSMSLDGFVAGPHAGGTHPLGEGGERLHAWLYELASWRRRHGLTGGTEGPESDALEESLGQAGAVVMGHGMYRVASGRWGDRPPYRAPVFVLTHTPREPDVRSAGTTFHFVTDGLESALQRARDAARMQDVLLAGGASVVRQAVWAGLLDELRLHIVPVLLGDGVRLFGDIRHQYVEWESSRISGESGVVHLRLRPPKRRPS
jgi:dihydrofolate reductase